MAIFNNVDDALMAAIEMNGGTRRDQLNARLVRQAIVPVTEWMKDEVMRGSDFAEIGVGLASLAASTIATFAANLTPDDRAGVARRILNVIERSLSEAFGEKV